MGMLQDVMQKRGGCVIVSILLGLGLASMFATVCKNRDCMIVKGPSVDYVTKHMWRDGNDCYKYSVKSVSCPDEQEAETPSDIIPV